MSRRSEIQPSPVTSVHFHSDCGTELGAFVNNPYLHDLTILCGNQAFFAHTDILRARCETLHNMFNQSPTNVMEIETDPAVILHLLKYLYTDRFPDISVPAEVIELLRLAKQLALQDLIINLKLRFHDVIRDRDSADRRSPQRDSETFEGEGESDSFTITRQTKQYVEPFLTASRFDGKVTVVVGQYKFRRQSAVLLAARSTWFAEHIDSVDGTVDASFIPVMQVALLLRFLRMEGYETIESFSMAMETMHWSWVMGAHSLQSWVEHVVVTRYLNCTNVCQIWSSPSCSEYLSERCMQFFQDNFMDCATSSGFLNLRPELMKAALNGGHIDADTISMMAALRRWAHINAAHPNESEQVLSTLLPPNTMFNMINRMTILGVNRRPITMY
uniref:BTB domain-containing protein n=1 Tax=Spongospora subterranea TaxID=70186 RepID=A0A0H5R736_9EUKA|eukprot:CRZ09928.1 hypothetical protein [Spongospora subterranea]